MKIVSCGAYYYCCSPNGSIYIILGLRGQEHTAIQQETDEGQRSRHVNVADEASFVLISNWRLEKVRQAELT